MATNIVGATGIDKVQDGIIVNADIDTVAASKLTGALPAISGASLTNIPAANITGTLPAISAANLTAIPAANITGALPAISGASLTGLTSSQLPAGSILEVKTENNTSGYDYSTATDIAIGSGVTFSSVGAGETILAVVMGGGLTLHRGTENTDGIATIEIGGTKIYGGKNYAGMSGDYDWYAGGVCQAHKYYSSAGSNILVQAYGHKNAGSRTSWNAAAGHSIQLVAYRIKGNI
jgi:hypothetical protein